MLLISVKLELVYRLRMLTNLEETLILNFIFENPGVCMDEVQGYLLGRSDIYPYTLQEYAVVGTDKEKELANSLFLSDGRELLFLSGLTH